jgi:hypothetical protein
MLDSFKEAIAKRIKENIFDQMAAERAEKEKKRQAVRDRIKNSPTKFDPKRHRQLPDKSWTTTDHPDWIEHQKKQGLKASTEILRKARQGLAETLVSKLIKEEETTPETIKRAGGDPDQYKKELAAKKPRTEKPRVPHAKSDSVESGNRPVTANSGLDRHKAYLKSRGELDTSVHKQGSSTVGKGSDRKSKVMKAIRKMSPERQRNFSTKGIADYLSKD